MQSNENDIMRILGRLEGATTQILDEVKTHQDRMNRIDENVEVLDHKLRGSIEGIDERLRRVEKKQYTVFVIATAAWTLIVGWFVKHFS